MPGYLFGHVSCTVISLHMAFECKPGCKLMSATFTLGETSDGMYSCVKDDSLSTMDTNLMCLCTMLTHLFRVLNFSPHSGHATCGAVSSSGSACGAV